MIVPLDLREVKRQVVSQEPVLGAGLLKRYLGIGERQLLKVVDLVRKRIVVVLGHTRLEQMKQDLCVLGIVLVPGVMHGFTGTSHGQGRNQLQM